MVKKTISRDRFCSQCCFFLITPKTFNIMNLIKMQSKLQRGISSYLSERPLSKGLQAINSGEVVEKREHSYTDAANACCEQPGCRRGWRFLKQRKVKEFTSVPNHLRKKKLQINERAKRRDYAKPLEENTRRTCFDINRSKFFLDQLLQEGKLKQNSTKGTSLTSKAFQQHGKPWRKEDKPQNGGKNVCHQI